MLWQYDQLYVLRCNGSLKFPCLYHASHQSVKARKWPEQNYVIF